MPQSSANPPKTLVDWIDARFPLLPIWREHISEYYAPKNFNFWYFFGSLAVVVLMNQLLSGLWLTMNYNPSAEGAFASVESIMRDVHYGWLIRYLHTTGASFFFIVLYLHMFRALLYGSYQAPRELIWLLGMGLFLALMAEAFMGYLLPWGQMSFWGAQVITSLFGAIPWVGESLQIWIMGDYTISGATLNRFFALHVIALPLLILGLVVVHIMALHHVGSNNPDGIDIKNTKNAKGIPVDGIAFHPYYTIKDLYGLGVFLLVFAAVVFFMPEGGGLFLEAPNFVAADPLQTPEHIAPVWYFTPFYSILRAIPDKLLGVLAMAASVAILFVLPWLDRSPVRSIRYKSAYYKWALGIFALSFIVLGYLGVLQPTPWRVFFSRLFTVCYFAFFLLMPWYSTWGTPRPLPQRVQAKYTSVYAWPWMIGLTLALLWTFSQQVWAAPSHIPLSKVRIDLHDKASLQRGAKYFMHYCSGCHSLQYVRYSQLARNIGLLHEDGSLMEDTVKDYLMFRPAKMGDTIRVPFQRKDAAEWFGVAPPDLSLVARSRGSDWVYSFLRAFYQDPSRPWGVNNLVYPNVAMPHVLEPLQGLLAVQDGHLLTAPESMVHVGALPASAYDAMVYDIVNFLTYMAEPFRPEREYWGWWVLLFLGVFTWFAYLLKREYWKDIH